MKERDRDRDREREREREEKNLCLIDEIHKLEFKIQSKNPNLILLLRFLFSKLT